MDQKEALEIVTKYLAKIKDIISYDDAYVFGSYANKTQREDSDIDVGIFISSLDDDYLEMLHKLYKARRSFDVRIEPHIFVNDTDPAGFSYTVRKNGIRM